MTSVFSLVLLMIFGQQSLNDRGTMAMGFDQLKTTHHFSLYEDGGSIQVTVNDPADTSNRDAIHAHLPHIAQMFAAGNFDTPMEVHAREVPGGSEMAKLKSRISYRYVELPNGGRVDILTKDSAAIKAVHEFLKFQISDHGTGDSMKISKRPAGQRQ